MARESITDLVYQFLRSLVHASFRDGAISGLRDAFGLPPPDGDGGAQVGDVPNGRHGAFEIRFAGRIAPGENRSLPSGEQAPAKKSAKSISGPDAPQKRGRGRPRKNPVDAERPAQGEEASS